MAALALNLLGGFDLRSRGGPPLDLSSKTGQALLAYLALTQGQRHARDKLAALLWEDRPDQQARTSLRQTLAVMRKALQPFDASWLSADGDWIAIGRDGFEIDVVEFERLAGLANAESLTQAAALYKGELLQGFHLRSEGFAEWLRTERERLLGRALQVLGKLLALQSEGVDIEAAIATANRLLSLDPLNENAHRSLMRLHVAQGRQELALRQYEICRDRLRRELNVGLDPATTTLHQEILARRSGTGSPNAAAPSWPAPSSPALSSPTPKVTIAAGPDAHGPARPSIAVLPFTNMSDDPRQDYFADGITEDLITDLSKVTGLFVVSRNSTFVYRDKAVAPAEVAENLGVRYLLEGSVRRAGDQLRINAQLVDAATSGHVWAERYDRALTDVFALQDDITRQIVVALQLELTESDRGRLASQDTANVRAYDAFLQAWERYRRNTPKDHAAAIPYFERAIALDSNYGRAHAGLALVYYDIADFSWNDQLGLSYDVVLVKSRRHLDQALQHPTSTAHLLAGEWLHAGGRFDEAIAESKRAVALDPSDSYALANHSNILTSAGRASDGLDTIDRVMQIDPHYPALYLHFLAKAQFGLGRFAEAAVSWERAMTRNPEFPLGYVLLAAAYGHLGRVSDAKAMIAKADTGFAGWERTTVLMASNWPYKYSHDLERILDGLRKSGVPELPFDYDKRAADRLSGDAIRALLFGHTILGHDAKSDTAFTVKRTADGVVTETWPAGSKTGRTVIEDDRICNLFPLHGRSCGAIFRNPAGTPTQQNEYILVSRDREMTFSVID